MVHGYRSREREKRQAYQKTLQALLLGIGVLLLCVAFYQVWVHAYNPYIRISFYRRGNYMLTLLYALLLLACIFVMKGQKVGEARLLEIIVSQCIALLMCTVIMYFPLSLLQYALLKPGPLLLLLLGQFVMVVLWNLFANLLYCSQIPPLRLLFVYETENGDAEIAAKLAGVPERFEIVASVSVQEDGESVAGMLPDYDAVLFSGGGTEWRERLAQFCFEQDRRLFWVPSATDVIVNSAKRLHTVDTPLLCTQVMRTQTLDCLIKRAFDLVASSLLLVVTSPLLLAAAIAIKLCDGGPVFFRQERLTIHGKLFRILKFRSMVVDAEKDGQRLAEQNDSRITPVGKLLRKTRMDELPQLINVIIGDMSIVGPRPECPSIAEEYEKTLPQFSYRLKVKAGITGYAQVYGSYTTSPKDKLLMDLMYIEGWSFLLDINLFLLTLRTLFMTEKTQGRQAKHDAVNRQDSIEVQS